MRRPRHPAASSALGIGLALALAACVASGAPSDQAGSASPSPEIASTGAPPSPSTARTTGKPMTPVPSAQVDGPPTARLAVEGGDPVAGQLGTYVWLNGGSDSPWLPGAPIAVGAAERLAMALEPDIGVDSWRARYVPASADDPEGASSLAVGRGVPAFAPPAPGSWTVEVHIVFADARGEASYFWRVEVS